MAPGFIEQHGLWSDDQRRHAEELKYRIEKDDIQLIRVAWADPHGASRAKTVTVPAFAAALKTGYNINVATTTLDSANARTFSSFTRGGGMGLDEMTGSPNLMIVPDPGTFRLLPWAPKVALGAVRRIFQQRRAVSFLAAATAAPANQAARRASGMGCVVGLEIEWYLLEIADPHLTEEHTGIPGVRGRPVEDRAGRARILLSLRIQHGPDAAGRSRRSPTRSRRSGCRCARSRTSGARASSNARSRRGRRWKRPTTPCCFAPPRGRSAAAWDTSRRSCAARRSRATIRAAGTCISPWSTPRAGAICSCRRQASDCLSPLGRHYLGGLMQPCRRPARRSRRRPSTATAATGRTRSRPTARPGATTIAA